MSFFISSNEIQRSKIKHSKSISQKRLNTETNWDFRQNLKQIFHIFEEGMIHLKQNDKWHQIIILHANFYKDYSLAQTIKVQKKGKIWLCDIKFLRGTSQICKLTNKVAFESLVFNLNRNHKFSDKLFSLTLNKGTRQIKVVSSCCFLQVQQMMMRKKHQILLCNFLKTVTIHRQKFCYIIQQIENILKFHRGGAQIQKNPIQEVLSKNLKRYGVIIELQQHDRTTYIHKTLKQQNMFQSQQNLLKKYIVFSRKQAKQLYLYTTGDESILSGFQSNDVQIDQFDLQTIKDRLQFPHMQKPPNKYENNYIFNCINIHKLVKMRPQPLMVGGFSSIFAASLQFWYIDSSNQSQIKKIQLDLKSQQSLIRKPVVMKTQNKHSDPRGSRIQHQNKILKKMKNGQAIFFTKYYFSLGQKGLDHTVLFADFIMQPTLQQYLQIFRQSISYRCKISLLFMITQALRYINRYDIVHFDLKPNNIIVPPDLFIKLIDFGQAYHPDVCLKNYQPGFSMPYSAPQNFSHKSFSQKNDVFSLGVLAYQLFYKKFPYFLTTKKGIQNVYSWGQLQRYMFLTPQDLASESEAVTWPFVQLAIIRCMSVNPNHRPELEWLALLFRQILDYYYQ